MSTDRLHIERRPGYRLVLDPASPHWAATNEDGAWILRQIRAARSLDEIAFRYSRRQDISLRRALDLVHGFAEEAGDFPSPDAHPTYQGRHHYLRPDRLREVWLHVTDRCNLSCRHCLVSSGPRGADGLDSGALRKIVRQARDLGADTFYFTGGEPFLHPDLVDLLREVTTNLGASAVVLTNGTLLDEDLCSRLATLPKDRFFLQVSLDGSSPRRNDTLRSPGSFDGALRGLRAARAAGLNVTIATVVLKRNLDDLIPIADLVHDLGVRHMHLMWQHVRERGGSLPRAGTRKLIKAVSALRNHARSLGLTVDNFENLRRTVNGDPGVKYDLSNACWDSLAVYRDGRVYPSACLVGLPSEAAGSALESALKDVWLHSDRLAACRERSVLDSGLDGDPWIFLHGGGDPEQAFFASNGNGRAPRDPYLPLHTALARGLIDDLVAERRRLIGDSPPGPVIYQLMGDDGYGCPTESGVLNGGAHKVDFVHSNCVLIQDVIAKSRAQIRDYYGEAARQPKTEICQPAAMDPRLLAHIPDEVVVRSYGCGSPVLAAELTPGETVVDLGSGAGLEAFIASRQVGPAGRVIGIDMTPDMLRFARDAARTVEERLGCGNVHFARALLEHLPLADASADAVISNCVINLSPEKLRVFAEVRRLLKPGGRLVISDLVSQQALPPEIRFNPRLKGECIAGAMTEAKLLAALRKLGFLDIEILQKHPWRTIDAIDFHTVTVRAFKPDVGGAALSHARRQSAVALDSGVSSSISPHHDTDCLVCGSPLVYLHDRQELPCALCGELKPADARCEEGHFVCDACHARDHLTFIRTFCRTTEEIDPVAAFTAMRRSHLFPLHGPEHHALVPAAFLTAYRNRFGEPPQGRLEAAVERGAGLPGGTCAYWGGCAAALGIGIAYATILRATPLSHQERGAVQTVVSRLLARIATFDSPRCCRRESYLALRMGCDLSAEFLPHTLPAGPLPPCDQMALNRECIGSDCPLHPVNAA